MQFEKDYFSPPFIRAHLSTTIFVQDTYYCSLKTENGHKFVYVKGPYKSRMLANSNNIVNKVKKFLYPAISVIEYDIVELLVQRDFLSCQHGIRTTWEEGTPGFFIVAPDMLQESIEGELPYQMIKSQKWTIPTKVVDYSHPTITKHFTYLWYHKDYSRTLYYYNKRLAIEFIKHILLSWIIGTSGNILFRDFFITQKQVFQTHSGKIGNMKWYLSQTNVGNIRSFGNKQLTSFIESNWNPDIRLFLSEVWTNIENDNNYFLLGIFYHHLADVKKRVFQIQSCKSLIKCIQYIPLRKRSRSSPPLLITEEKEEIDEDVQLGYDLMEYFEFNGF